MYLVVPVFAQAAVQDHDKTYDDGRGGGVPDEANQRREDGCEDQNGAAYHYVVARDLDQLDRGDPVVGQLPELLALALLLVQDDSS